MMKLSVCWKSSIKVNTVAVQMLKSNLLELSFNIIMRMVVGKRYFGEKEDSKEAKHFCELIDEAFSLGVVTIEWDLWALLNYQEKLERAKGEIDSLVGNDHLVVESDLSKLYYLQTVISETFRLFLAALLVVPHEASDNCRITHETMRNSTLLSLGNLET
ncbi:unnamed protein product [Fraxinus pennsylvanica]|uniref:Uncharacterized protein n=1 Tax=Fraxinus pennsylvanica TaxID=56036 RepID=A0AAD1YRB8_9LAMI|nr:unnamed protein product [Fraxinus pennsylvanica]